MMRPGFDVGALALLCLPKFCQDQNTFSWCNEDEAAEGLQQPNSGDEADEDKGSENESDKEEISVGSQKYIRSK